MIIDVTAEMKDINFVPASEYEEILQNVRTIINTLKKTVPMDREFGINGEVIDLPIAAAQAKITGEIVAAVSKYEPRPKLYLWPMRARKWTAPCSLQ
ncbi:hypothetical protein [Selenomonas sp. AB3002]|uniref:hypothetical protein n=1 Tax=Selenomonas sp. AB3002 TaxID=1392502 RepID=UPI0009B92E89